MLMLPDKGKLSLQAVVVLETEYATPIPCSYTLYLILASAKQVTTTFKLRTLKLLLLLLLHFSVTNYRKVFNHIIIIIVLFHIALNVI